ncbi:hypothetical protein OHB26_39325 (plasmid) [Nocardia sp. NBC_01503]|uniref:hypothetical protein n=1 Tax=Nocardia sp. NBC_01503 TaxID=2975997 RepID=UPI002E7AFE5B|nr:hypothetical protein [Nocardia sp. NBC_01503]WTL36731.1 hypothetical protein OHB26_39325 [Nocardia sp. NBC_01503]
MSGADAAWVRLMAEALGDEFVRAHAQDLVPSQWRCSYSGELTTEQAHEVMRMHRTCTADTCRIKHTAVNTLAEAIGADSGRQHH